MTHAMLRDDVAMLQLTFDDGIEARYPYLWLRDNDPAGFHPETEERMTDLTTIALDVAPEAVAIEGPWLLLSWRDATQSRFDLSWLRANRPGQVLQDPAQIAPTPWRADLAADAVPRGDAEHLLHNDAALRDWLQAAREAGLALVTGLADDRDAGVAVARRIGFLRETNFGVTFEVQSKPNPNNLAYTAVALPLHTDLTNQELPPGFQFLHCLRNEATGGGSLFCDGFAVAEDLRQQDPAAFELLSQVSIPFRFHDGETDIRSRKRVITLDEAGAVTEICFNAHLAGILDLEPELMQRYYPAYRLFMQMSRMPAYRVEFKLAAGEMVVFDNRRVLHGRDAFDPNTGARHLRGCYVDRGEFDSRLRLLTQQVGTGAAPEEPDLEPIDAS